jgi:hypothetical protein
MAASPPPTDVTAVRSKSGEQKPPPPYSQLSEPLISIQAVKEESDDEDGDKTPPRSGIERFVPPKFLEFLRSEISYPPVLLPEIAPFRFLEIPFEVRRNIYHVLLGHPRIVDINTLDSPNTDYLSLLSYSHKPLAEEIDWWWTAISSLKKSPHFGIFDPKTTTFVLDLRLTCMYISNLSFFVQLTHSL